MSQCRIIVAGSRTFDVNTQFLKLVETVDSVIDKIGNLDDVLIISGNAKGVDKAGELYAHNRGYDTKVFRADWDNYGKSAGFIRNRIMAEFAAEEDGHLVALWDGKSPGTKHMIEQAAKFNLGTTIVYI